MSVDAVLIAGPTASGKSGIATALAERLEGVVVNTDSMQVYREARILTARPSKEDEARAPHRLYGHVGVDETYSVARYQSEAGAAFEAARAEKRIPVFAGGTGLYFGALTEGLADIPAVPPDIRAHAKALRDELGADAFFEALKRRDPESAERLRASDSQRVLRAFEVFEATERPLGEWQREKPIPGPLANARVARFVVAPRRAELYRQIDRRFEAMLAAGAMEEAARLKGLDPSRPATKILGLRELQAAAAGAMTLDEAKKAAQTASRRYAKRQLIWFRRRMADWTWVEADGSGNFLTKVMSDIT
jgi:tRNA dimethylallyltransferase